MKYARRWLALLLSLLLPLSAAQAGGLSLTDPLANAYLDGNGDVHFAVSAQLDELIPYGEGTIELFNDALKHISMSASITESGARTALEVCVAGDPVISLEEAATDGGMQLTTPLLPNRVLTSQGSAMDALSGAEETAFDLFMAISEAEQCYQALTDAILPYAEEKKASYTIKNIASSKWSRVARLTTEQSGELAPLIASVLSCGLSEAYTELFRSLSYGKGFVVALYQSEKGGRDLAVYMKGDVILPDGSKRALSYQWAWTAKDGGKRYDTYKLELTKAKAPKDNLEINAFYKRSTKADTLLLDGECEVVVMQDGVTTTTTVSHDLSGKESGSARTVKGEMSTAVKTAADGKSTTVTTTAEPNVKLTSADGSGVLSGTVHVETKQGKTVQLSADLTFDEEPAEVFLEAAESGTLFVVIEDSMPPSSLTQNMEEETEGKPDAYLVGKPPIGYESHTAPSAEETVNLDTLSDTGRAALEDELAQNLAGKLLIALSKLPEEATGLLRDNLSAEDYAAFEALAEGL